MFVVIMILALGSAFALLAFQVSSTELAIARYGEDEVTAQYLAESGIEKVLSWATSPNRSPRPVFFASLSKNNCTGNRESPDFPKPEFKNDRDFMENTSAAAPFSSFKNLGKIVDLRLYAPTHLAEGICTVEVTSETATGARAKVRVNIALNPLGKITAGIQGAGNEHSPSPLWVHWGEIRYIKNVHLGPDLARVPLLDSSAFPTGEPYSIQVEDPFMTLNVQGKILSPIPDNQDTYLSRPNATQNKGSSLTLDQMKTQGLRSFIKKQGDYYTVSADGQHLLKNGAHILDKDGNHIDHFDDIYNGETGRSHLVWIDNHNTSALKISGGKFKGYFYFSGAIVIEGGVQGREVSAQSPPVASYPDGLEVQLSNINLEGLFAAKDVIELKDRFTAYGALYGLKGFKGKGASDLEVWYNARFAQSIYPGIRTVTPLIGTWVSVPIDAS